MSSKSWRDIARAHIATAKAEGEQQGLTGKALRDFVNGRYPFGERKYHPYKMWCDEMKRTFDPEKCLPPPRGAYQTEKTAKDEAAALAAWNAGEPRRVG